MNQSFRSGASLHSLISDAPVPALLDLLASLNLQRDLPHAGEEPVVRQALIISLGDLDSRTSHMVDALARRLLTLSGERGCQTLKRVAAARLTAADLAELTEQPDAIGRAIHCWRNHQSVFEDAESLQHAQHYRDFSPIFTAFDAPVAATFHWDEHSERRLRERIVADLGLEGPVSLSHLEVADEGEGQRNHVVIVRHGEAPSSVAAHGEDGGRNWIYYRPSIEVTLIYSPSRGIVEVCAPSPSLRQDVAVAFAEVGLGQDLSSKPLSFKVYNLSRLRKCLTLPFHQPDGDLTVERIAVVEAEVCLGDHQRRMTLKVPVGDDIEAIAVRCLGGRRMLMVYPVVRVAIAVEYRAPNARRTRTLKITLAEPNRCNLRGNRDPELRKLGYDLLEHWGAMQALRTLGPDEGRKLLPTLLELYDMGATSMTEHELNTRGFDVAAFTGYGFLEPAGRLTSMLIDEEDGHPEVVEVGRGVAGAGEFEDFRGGIAWQPKTLVTKYSIHREWIRETVLKAMLPTYSSRPVATAVPELYRLGELSLGDEAVVCYFASGLSGTRTVRMIDNHLRGESTPAGLILSAGEPANDFIGSNVVVNVASFLRNGPDGGTIDLDQLRLAYRAARARARNGHLIEFAISGDGVATLHVPGKPPLTVTGGKQIGMVERLFEAQQNGTLLVSTGALLKDGSCTHPKQAFSNWSEVEGVYIGSSRKGYWQLLC